jgi:Xaa-Pro aminopeptidase
VQEIAARRGYPETAWERPLCPGVYSGVFRDLSHAPATQTVIAPGDILWVDFGIKDRGYATDVIRAAYLLREGESAAPAPVAAMFQAARAANRAAAAAMKPGVAGWQVDAVARESVVAAGYPEFFHGTGHPVGFDVHDAGPALAQKSRGNAALLPLEQDQVFAVEPSVLRPMPELRGSWLINIEEEVLVTATGGEYLSPPQEELILIPPACAHD